MEHDQSPPPADIHVNIEDDHDTPPPAVDDFTPQEHHAAEDHDQSPPPAHVQDDINLKKLLAAILARVESHPHEATPRALQDLNEATGAMIHLAFENAVRDLDGSETTSESDVQEAGPAVMAHPKPSVFKMAVYPFRCLWQSFATNPYHLHPGWYVLILTLFSSFSLLCVAEGGDKMRDTGDVWDLVKGTSRCFPAMAAMILFLFPALMIQY